MTMFLPINIIKYMINTFDWCQQCISNDIINLVADYHNVPINHVEFVFHQIDSESYQIHVIFDDDMKRQRAMTFTKNGGRNLDMKDDVCMDGYIHFISDLAKKGSNVLDLWPLNGIIKKKQFIKNTLKGELKYLEELSKIFKIKKDKKYLKNNSLKLMVLDLKDKDSDYQNKEIISNHERKIGEFFHKNNKSKINKKAKKQLSIYNLVCGEFEIEYILKEGSLKHDLLYASNIFNEQEIEYFNGSDGGKDLCQLCELIMNGFKTLYQIEIHQNNSSYIFNPRDYLIHIPSLLSKKKETIKMSELQNIEYLLSDIDLITLYPQCYLNVYSKDKPYYECISKFNRLQLQHCVFDDFSNITCIQIQNTPLQFHLSRDI